MRAALLFSLAALSPAASRPLSASAQPSDEAPVDETPPEKEAPDAKAPDAKAPAPAKGRWSHPGKYPMNEAALQLQKPGRPDGILGDDIDGLGRQLKVSTDKLRKGAGAEPMPDMSPRNTYLNQVMFPMQTPIMAGLQNPLANPWTNPLMKIGLPIVSDPFNPMHLWNQGLLGIRSPRITQHSQAIPPLPYPFYNEP